MGCEPRFFVIVFNCSSNTKSFGGLMDRAADSGLCSPSLIPLGERKENKRKEAGFGPYLKNVTLNINIKLKT